MTPLNQYPTSSSVEASILTELRFLREDVSELKADLQNNTVSRREWEQHNRHVNVRIKNLEHAIESGRAPWWTWITVIVATGALLWTVFGPALTY